MIETKLIENTAQNKNSPVAFFDEIHSLIARSSILIRQIWSDFYVHECSSKIHNSTVYM